MSNAQLATAFAKLRENFRAIVQGDSGVFSNTTELLMELKTTGTTTRVGLVRKAGNGTTSSRNVFDTFESLETVPQRWDVGMVATRGFAVRNFTSGRSSLTIDETTDNVGIGGVAAAARLQVHGGWLLLTNSATGATSGNGVLLGQDGFDSSLGLTVWNYENGGIRFGTNATVRMTLDAAGNVVFGSAALAVGATAGFVYLPTCPGTPTGAPAAYAGRVPAVADSATSKLWINFGGVWKSAVFS